MGSRFSVQNKDLSETRRSSKQSANLWKVKVKGHSLKESEWARREVQCPTAA